MLAGTEAFPISEQVGIAAAGSNVAAGWGPGGSRWQACRSTRGQAVHAGWLPHDRMFVRECSAALV